MSYKTILVHVDQGERFEVRLEIALRLAAKFEARIVGLHAVSVMPVPGYLLAEAGRSILDRQREVAVQRQHEAEARFRAAVRNASPGSVSVEWRATFEDAARILPLYARYADIAILGQPQSFEQTGVERGLAERVLITAGRPVMFVPYAGEIEVRGDRMLVAWNASREATRAIADALPLLKLAARVDVVSFHAKRRQGHGEIPGVDIGLWLARHGVTVEVAGAHAEEIDVGNQLLSRAADAGSNLIVMGGYGHSRFAELILGGATRTVLSSMTVPVLMSH